MHFFLIEKKNIVIEKLLTENVGWSEEEEEEFEFSSFMDEVI